MSLTLDPTPGGNNANVYADLAYALAKADAWVEGAAFVELSDADKQSQLLATAARKIDSYGRKRFVGDKETASQAMEVPRDNGAGVTPSLKDANVLYAFNLADRLSLGTIGVPLETKGQVKREKVAAIEVEYFALTALPLNALGDVPDEVVALLEDLLEPLADASAWSFDGVAERVS